MRTSEIPVGTMVRCWSEDRNESWIGVVVPVDRAAAWWDVASDKVDLAATMPLDAPRSIVSNVGINGAWMIGFDGHSEWNYEICADDRVSDELLSLAGRALLDDSFIPRVEESGK